MRSSEQNISVKETVGPYYLIELHDDRFLAVPTAVEGKTLEELEVAAGAIFGESLEDLKQKIDDILSWANSRGQLEKADPSQSAVFMRANSFAVAREQIKGKLIAGKTLQARDGKSYIIKDSRKVASSWIQQLGEMIFLGKALIRAGFRFLRSRNINSVKTVFSPSQVKTLKRILTKGARGNRQVSIMTTPYATYFWLFTLGLYREIQSLIRFKKQNNVGSDSWPTMVVGLGSEPEMIFSGKQENVVKYDQYYFIIPHGVPVDWNDLELLSSFPHSPNLKTLYEMLDKTFGSVDRLGEKVGRSNELLAIHSRPEVVKELTEYGYRIVLFEGWYIGVPWRLYEVDLTKQDILSEPGVIRDVALEVVELEIVEAAG